MTSSSDASSEADGSLGVGDGALVFRFFAVEDFDVFGVDFEGVVAALAAGRTGLNALVFCVEVLEVLPVGGILGLSGGDGTSNGRNVCEALESS